MNTPVTKYTKSAIILHWLIGIVIIALLALGLFMSEIPRDLPKVHSLDLFNLGLYSVQFAEAVTPRTFYFNLHKSIGVTVFVLILWRIVWRLTHPAPAYPASMPSWERTAAGWSHALLYVLMVLMTVSGLLMTLYSKYGLLWFGVRVFDGLDNDALREVFMEIHEITAYVLIALIVLHVLAALKHKLIDKDEVMSRMSLR